MRPFADLVQMHLRRRGLSQTRLAARIGVAQPSLAAWLSGRRPMPVRRVQFLVEALHLRGRARDDLVVAAWLTAAPAPVARLVEGALARLGSRSVARLVRQVLVDTATEPREPRPPGATGSETARA